MSEPPFIFLPVALGVDVEVVYDKAAGLVFAARVAGVWDADFEFVLLSIIWNSDCDGGELGF